MRIVDVWKQDNLVLAYCTGSDVEKFAECRKISIGGTVYHVSGTDLLTSIAGSKNVVLCIDADDPANVPLGEISLVERKKN